MERKGARRRLRKAPSAKNGRLPPFTLILRAFQSGAFVSDSTNFGDEFGRALVEERLRGVAAELFGDFSFFVVGKRGVEGFRRDRLERRFAVERQNLRVEAERLALGRVNFGALRRRVKRPKGADRDEATAL